MKKLLNHILMCAAFISSFTNVAQETLRLEIAPYIVPCNENESNNCMQLLNVNGDDLNSIPLDGIKGFTVEEGFEYTIDVIPVEKTELEQSHLYILKKEISKMWVPQYATDAPTLGGSFQVVGFNGKSIDTNDINLIINASNRVMRGSTGCNNYHLFFKQLGYSLVFSKILATHMFCASRSALEEEYFVIFNSVHHFKYESDVLRLYDITDKELLEAVRLK